MSSLNTKTILSPSPHLHAPVSIQKIMILVIITLIPAIIMSVLYFGGQVLFLYLLGAAVCVLTELLFKLARRRSPKSVLDGSAVLTGLLLVMTLPPTISPVLVILGAAVAVFIGKEVFGGLGSNIFNPALVGRAFLAAAYPARLNQYRPPSRVFGFLEGGADSVSGATPLAQAKFEGSYEPVMNMLFGQTGGSIGETAAVFLIIGGLVLMLLKIIRWRLVLSYLGSVFVFSGIFYLADPAAYPSPIYHLFAGGLVLGAFYMATDMVTSPYTHKGNILIGILGGFLVVIIRLFGGLPEGVMYSILLMNAVTPIANRYFNNRVFGAEKAESGGQS